MFTITMIEMPEDTILVTGSEWLRSGRYPIDVFRIEVVRDRGFLNRSEALETAARAALRALALRREWDER